MSDPLSVAGTVVGITSLGIQVCQGLVSYLRSIKGRSQDIEDGLRDIQNVVVIFYSLNDLLPKLNQQKCTASTGVRQCLRESEDQLCDLQNLLIKLRGPQNCTSAKGKMLDVGRSIIYPFHKGKLKSLRDTLQRLLHNLNLVIDVVSLEFEAVHHDRIEYIGSTIETIQATSHVQNDQISTLHTQMERNLEQLRAVESSITSILGEVSQRLKQTEWAVRDLDSNVTGKLSLIQTDTRATALSSQVTTEKLDQILQLMESDRVLMSKMAMQISHIQPHPPQEAQGQLTLQSDFGHSSLLPISTSLATASRPTELRKKPPSLDIMATLEKAACTCPLKVISSTISCSMWNFKLQFEQQQPPQHRQGCKFYGIDKKTNWTTKGQLPLKVLWLSSKISLVCFEISTGTSSPGISVRYQNLVPNDCSPVYEELKALPALISARGSSTEIIQSLQSLERTIIAMYRDGKAAPSDRDERGRSHAKIIADMLTGYDINSGPATFMSILLAEEWATRAILRFLNTFFTSVKQDDALLDLTRLVITFTYFDAERFSLESTANILDNFRVFATYLMHKFECKSYNHYFWRNPSFLRETPIITDNIFSSLSELGMKIPQLTRIILSQSLTRLEKCISQDPKAVLEKFMGATTLHICTPWPQGLQRLLMTEARTLVDEIHESANGVGNLPIHHAIRLRSTESVDLLMTAGCRIHLRQYGCPDESRVIHLFWAHRDIIDMFAVKLAERRRGLLMLAKRELGITQNSDPSDSPDVADGKAAYLCEALANAGITVHPTLQVDHCYKTVFHSPDLPFHCFSIFFERGFRDHKCHNSIGLTPIMVPRGRMWGQRRLHSLLPWLEKEGFLDSTPKDPLQIGLNTYATGWHYLAAFSAWAVRVKLVRPLPFDSPHLTAARALSQVAVRDCCTCWCSSGGKGCLPLMSLWKELATSQVASSCSSESVFQHATRGAIPSANNLPTWESEFVRFLTFEALEMTHTCCAFGIVSLPPHSIPSYCTTATDRLANPSSNRYHGKRMSLRLILMCEQRRFQAIRSDNMEQKSAHQLATLMEDFDEKIRALDPFPRNLEKFIWGYWRKRISKLYSVDKHEVGQMEEHVRDIETYVVPTRLRKFLGDDFNFIRYNKDDDDENWDDGTAKAMRDHDDYFEIC